MMTTTVPMTSQLRWKTLQKDSGIVFVMDFRDYTRVCESRRLVMDWILVLKAVGLSLRDEISPLDV